MKCTNCGAEVSENSKFCSQCGTVLNHSSVSSVSEANEQDSLPANENEGTNDRTAEQISAGEKQNSGEFLSEASGPESEKKDLSEKKEGKSGWQSQSKALSDFRAESGSLIEDLKKLPEDIKTAVTDFYQKHSVGTLVIGIVSAAYVLLSSVALSNAAFAQTKTRSVASADTTTKTVQPSSSAAKQSSSSVQKKETTSKPSASAKETADPVKSISETKTESEEASVKTYPVNAEYRVLHTIPSYKKPLDTSADNLWSKVRENYIYVTEGVYEDGKTWLKFNSDWICGIEGVDFEKTDLTVSESYEPGTYQFESGYYHGSLPQYSGSEYKPVSDPEEMELTTVIEDQFGSVWGYNAGTREYILIAYQDREDGKQISSEFNPAAAIQHDKSYYRALFNVKIRQKPDLDSDKVGLIDKDDQVEIIKIEKNGDYTWGQLADQSGWVCLKEGSDEYFFQLD